MLVLDLETGIVRDIFSFNGLLGTMPCYHDGITDNAIIYGNNLLSLNSSENIQFNGLVSICLICSSMGSYTAEICTLGITGSTLIVPTIIGAAIIIGFQIISPLLADYARDNNLNYIAEFYDLELIDKIQVWIDYYLYQDGLIMDGINEFNTQFEKENHDQIESNKKEFDDIIKKAQKIANELNVPIQTVLASMLGGPKPNPLFYIHIFIIAYALVSYNLNNYNKYNINTTYELNYDFNKTYYNEYSIIINQTILEGY